MLRNEERIIGLHKTRYGAFGLVQLVKAIGVGSE